jgi:DNA-binding transcriptional regulator YhcF (GntR family)
MSTMERAQPTDIPQYVQLASWLRAEIVGGRIPLGGRLPGEETLKRDFGVDRSVVRRAVQLLRDEGLVVTKRGVGSFVAAVPQLRVAVVYPGDRVTARMADEAEREKLRPLGPGVPVLVITRAEGGEPEVYSAAVTVLHVGSKRRDASSRARPLVP